MSIPGPQSPPPKPVTDVWRPEVVRLPRLTRRREWFRGLMRGVMKAILRLSVRPELRGIENLPKRGPFVLVINHLGVNFRFTAENIQARALGRPLEIVPLTGSTVPSLAQRLFYILISHYLAPTLPALPALRRDAEVFCAFLMFRRAGGVRISVGPDSPAEIADRSWSISFWDRTSVIIALLSPSWRNTMKI